MRADVSTVYCKPRTHRRAIFATYKIQKMPTCNVRVGAEVQVHERIVDAEVLVVQHVVVRVVVEPAGGFLLARVPLPSGTWYPQCQSRRQYSLRTIGVLYKRAGWADRSTAQVQRPKGSRDESDQGSRCGHSVPSCLSTRSSGCGTPATWAAQHRAEPARMHDDDLPAQPCRALARVGVRAYGGAMPSVNGVSISSNSAKNSSGAPVHRHCFKHARVQHTPHTGDSTERRRLDERPHPIRRYARQTP